MLNQEGYLALNTLKMPDSPQQYPNSSRQNCRTRPIASNQT